MGKMASKKSVEQLERLFDFLGKYGGTIETNNSENWWTLDLEVESIKGSKKNIMIGTVQIVNGDVLFDPRFDVELTMNGGKIAGAEIMYYMSQNLFDVIEIDEEDIMYSGVGITKPSMGLRKLFAGFMDNMTEVGPYLTDSKNVKKYDHTLAD